MVNFVLFIWSSRLFIQLTFEYLYGQLEFFIWSTFYFLKRRLQTGGKVQTEGKMLTEDYRPGVKGRFGS